MNLYHANIFAILSRPFRTWHKMSPFGIDKVLSYLILVCQHIYLYVYVDDITPVSRLLRTAKKRRKAKSVLYLFHMLHAQKLCTMPFNNFAPFQTKKRCNKATVCWNATISQEVCKQRAKSIQWNQCISWKSASSRSCSGRVYNLYHCLWFCTDVYTYLEDLQLGGYTVSNQWAWLQ